MSDKLSPSPKTFSKILLQWYCQQGRELPWRKTKDPYAIWVSEVMLQQTQVERVKGYYRKFLKRFPKIQNLAEASWPDVLEQWRGLGYYRRARHLHSAAQYVLRDHQGQIPQNYQSLRKLPGIGPYTAGAIASFAFDQNLPAIDTNVEEVFQHVFGKDFWQTLKPQAKYNLVQSFIPPKQSADFHHALMDLGTALKTTLRADHQNCPFKPHCKEVRKKEVRNQVNVIRTNLQKNTYHSQNNNIQTKNNNTHPQNNNPQIKKNVKPQTNPQKVIRNKNITMKNLISVAVGLLVHDGKILITQRKKEDSFGGYWEFPGGKLNPGEDARTCLKREMKEEIDVEVSVRPPLYVTTAIYGSKQYKISFHRCSLLLGTVKAKDVAAYQWIQPQELPNYKFPPANKPVLDILVKKKSIFYV